MTDIFNQIGGEVVNALAKPVTDRINLQIDSIANAARNKIAAQRSIAPNQVTDLDVAEYIIAMPTAETNKVLVDVGTSARNGIIIAGALIAAALVLSRR